MTVVRNGQKLTMTPDTALAKYHLGMFAQPGTTGGGGAIPSH